jgi:hypothetical protein
MNPSAPVQITWIDAMLFVVFGLIAHLMTIPVLSGLAFAIVLGAAALLLAASFVPGLWPNLERSALVHA